MEARRRTHRLRPPAIAVVLIVASLLATLCAGSAAAAAGGPVASKSEKAAAAPRKKPKKRAAVRRHKAVKPAPSSDGGSGSGATNGAAVGASSSVAMPSASTPKSPTGTTRTATPTIPSTTPTPPPTQTTPATPTTGFSASSLRQFWLQQSARGAITEVPDPAGSGQTVFKLTVGDNDGYPVTPTTDPRAELLSPSTIKAGDEFWWSTKFFLPSDFPSSIPGWMNLVQVFGSPASGSPPFHLELNGEYLQWTRNQTYGWDVPWRMPLVKNQWVTVMVHEKFASDGFVEMWINGQQVSFFNSGGYNPKRLAATQRLEMQTMDSSNSGANNSVFIQSYRKKGMFASLTSYAGPLTIGSTRASVGG
jgi:hypothetical protein